VSVSIAEVERLELPSLDSAPPCQMQRTIMYDDERAYLDCREFASCRVMFKCECGHVKFMFVCDYCLSGLKYGLVRCRKCDRQGHYTWKES